MSQQNLIMSKIIHIYIYIYIYIYIEMLDCGESNNIVEISGKFEKSNT